jgi:hypothetical protein
MIDRRIVARHPRGWAFHILPHGATQPFKCQHALSRAMLEFIDAETGTFSATYHKVVPPFDVLDRLFGRFAISAEHIASAVV